MTPEPTPVSGMTPRSPEFALPVTVMRTTAGLTLAATAMVADDSSMVTGWVVPTLCPVTTEAAGAGWSKAPLALRATTVPPEARIADRRAAARTGPIEFRFRATVGATGAAAAGAAGSYQRSGVVGGTASYSRIQSGRLSGAGE